MTFTGNRTRVACMVAQRFAHSTTASKAQAADQTRIMNTNLDVFMQFQHTRTTLRKKNMGQSLFKKHSKFLNFNEISYCGMTAHKNSILNYCGLCRYVKAVKPKEAVRKRLFKNHFKFQNFNIQ